ncbi:NAD-dependent epimerase/dehydratase family protein [Xanthomonas hyacinthi]|uniref:GDP-mannose 4,6 dehydratase n=1 Tax=Xanthomonas hyacinthi TaxID=56455 RepID=A0A2S7F3Q7_9XANT|nr:NAD-dependent epimerase/dehydratase family protein [Xanthomonas hyacinthi]KLD75831.1 GDP-6-deoxy-D-lyxo-4-hexulose reductase [Xanthomonas hyacinthi DSM 19077]PPU99983.1 GDP-mannose 4,6 dehydratase [Xanthomonas hyacinthi]QGY76161.1 NAD-dependent epimerase/dehydratase family protein [Xanthomonas hyacinthi]
MNVVLPSDLAGKRILVTGASGFTGRYVTAELKRQGCEVVGLGGADHSVPQWARGLAPADRHYHADLRDRVALREALEASRPDIIVHLAALAFVGHGSADDFYNVNLMGTRHLLEAVDAAALSPVRLLIASSANVYGNSSAGRLDESISPAPANDYAISKLAMEHVVRLWQGRLPLIVVRPFNYTGRGQADNFLIPKIVSHFARRESRIELGNLDVSRDFGDVRAVASAYRQLLESDDAVGRTINVCSGTAYSLQEVIDLCAQIAGHTLDVAVNPAFVRTNEVKVLCGDNGLLQVLTAGTWSCPPLRQTLEWMLETG